MGFAEIVALRKKYDDLVAFTVNLTAERDSISLDLPNSHTCPDGVPQDKTASFGGSSLNAERCGMDSDMPPASSMTSVISISLISCLFGWCFRSWSVSVDHSSQSSYLPSSGHKHLLGQQS